MSAEAWYLDTSAFLKLVEAEAESEALVAWAQGTTLASSDLLRTEALRASRRAGPAALERCRALLRAFPLLRVDASVFETAATLDPVELRSLDAIHLAAAMTLSGDLAGVVTYDRQLAAGAEALGLAVAAPR